VKTFSYFPYFRHPPRQPWSLWTAHPVPCQLYCFH